jgi:NAD(P)H-dependent FMN reductase
MVRRDREKEKSTMKILVFAASLRKASINKKLATLIAGKLSERDCEVDHEVDFHAFDMPLFDEDLEDAEGTPPGATMFVERIRAADGLVIVTPEYNHSIPGPLKNAIDWMSRSRPYPTLGKTAMIAAAANSMVGGYRGLMALQEPLSLLGAWVSPGKFGLAQASKAFDGAGGLVDPAIDKLLDGMLDNFVATVKGRNQG